MPLTRAISKPSALSVHKISTRSEKVGRGLHMDHLVLDLLATKLWLEAPNRRPHLGLQKLEVHRRQLVRFRELHIGLNFTSSCSGFGKVRSWPRKSPDIRRRGRWHLGQGS